MMNRLVVAALIAFAAFALPLVACDRKPEPLQSEAPKAVVTALPVEVKTATPVPTAPSIPAPADVAAAPADAQKTKSGLASKVITKGTGSDHPAETDTVKVHYTGWKKTGEMFDSSVARGEPTEFPLNGVIKGWTEGVQLMVVGEKRRFWIPGARGWPARLQANLCLMLSCLKLRKHPSPVSRPLFQKT
jgi:FKBP-type peptidyl-prolyl cis-trans isomerase